MKNIHAFIGCLILLASLSWAQGSSLKGKDIPALSALLRESPSDTMRAAIFVRFSYLMARNAPDSAVYYAQKGFDLAEKIQAHSLAANAKLCLGIVERRRGNNSAALLLNEEAYIWGKKARDLSLQAIAQGNIGNIYCDKGDFMNALKGYQESSLIFEALKDTANAAAGYINIAALMADNLKDFDGAIGVLQKNIALMEQTHDFNPSMLLALTYLNLGELNHRKGENETGIGWMLKSLQMYRAIGDKAGMADLYPTLVRAYIGKKEYERALHYADLGIQTATELDYRDGIIENSLCKSEVLRLWKEPEKALEILQYAEKIANEGDHTVYLTEIYQEYALVYKDLHQRKLAKSFAQKAASSRAEMDAVNEALRQGIQGGGTQPSGQAN